MNHYCGDDGLPIEYVNKNEDMTAIAGVFIKKWNYLCKLNLGKEKHHKIMMMFSRSFLWRYYSVAYDFELQTSMIGLGGCEIKRPEKEVDAAIYDILVRWRKHNMIPRELPLHLHNMVMDVILELTFHNED